MLRISRFPYMLAAVAAVCALTSASLEAHEVSNPDLAALSSVYELKDFAAAGIYSSDEEAEARDFIGYFLTVHGDHIVLPTAELCHAASTEHTVLKDHRETSVRAVGPGRNWD